MESEPGASHSDLTVRAPWQVQGSEKHLSPPLNDPQSTACIRIGAPACLSIVIGVFKKLLTQVKIMSVK